MPFAANSYLAYLRARGALTTDPGSLKPYAALANDLTDPKSYALTLSACDNMAGILALGTTGTVMIGHHFLFNMKTPFAVDGSNQLVMLTGHHTVDNPVALDPLSSLAIQTSRTFPCPTWDTLAAAPDGDSVKTVTPTCHNPRYSGGPRPLMPIPPWLAAALMDAGTNNAADLCLIAIQTIRDFDTRATTSPAAAATLAAATATNPDDEEANDDDDDDDDNDNDDAVLVTHPDTAQAILWRIPIFLWAVATSKIAGGTVTLTDSLPVERWCATVRSRCFGSPFGPHATTPAHTMGTATPRVTPDNNTLETRFGTVLRSLERHFQLADERAANDKAEKEGKAFRL
jgi:hypothetical protein